MGFIGISNNQYFQVKKECLVEFQSSKKTSLVYNSAIKIKYNYFPAFTVQGVITFEGVEYPYNVPLPEFVAKMNSYYQIYKNFIVSVDYVNILLVFTKRNKTVPDFGYTSTQLTTLQYTQVIALTPDTDYPVELIMFNNNSQLIGTLSKATPINHNVIFDVQSILKNNISFDFQFRNSFAPISTPLISKFKLVGATISPASLKDERDVYAIKTNLNESDLLKIKNGGEILAVNNKRRYIGRSSNEKIFFTRNIDLTSITVTAYNYARKNSEVYSLNISSLLLNTIYELPTSFNILKYLFTEIAEDKIVEFVITIGDKEINYIVRNAQQIHEFVYLNKFSVWDNIIFNTKNEEHLEIESDSIQTKDKIIITSKKFFNKRVQNSAFILSNDLREHYIDFLTSEKIYEIIDGVAYEIILNDNTYLLKQLNSWELNNFQFEYNYANYITQL